MSRSSEQRGEHGMTQNPVYGLTIYHKEFKMTKNELYESACDVQLPLPEEYNMTENQLYKRVSVIRHDA